MGLCTVLIDTPGAYRDFDAVVGDIVEYRLVTCSGQTSVAIEGDER